MKPNKSAKSTSFFWAFFPHNVETYIFSIYVTLLACSLYLPLLVHFFFSWCIAAPCWSVELCEMRSARPTVSPRFFSTLPALEEGLAEPTIIMVIWEKHSASFLIHLFWWNICTWGREPPHLQIGLAQKWLNHCKRTKKSCLIAQSKKLCQNLPFSGCGFLAQRLLLFYVAVGTLNSDTQITEKEDNIGWNSPPMAGFYMLPTSCESD